MCKCVSFSKLHFTRKSKTAITRHFNGMHNTNIFYRSHSRKCITTIVCLISWLHGKQMWQEAFCLFWNLTSRAFIWNCDKLADHLINSLIQIFTTLRQSVWQMIKTAVLSGMFTCGIQGIKPITTLSVGQGKKVSQGKKSVLFATSHFYLFATNHFLLKA